MSNIAPTLEQFFTAHLIQEVNASPNTIAAYRDAWVLLLAYVHDRTSTPVHQLDLAVFDEAMVGGFLTYLQTERGNGIRTRNARLAAIHAFFAYAATHHPEHARSISGVMNLPMKRHERINLTFLTEDEARTLVDSPTTQTRAGRRDRVMLLTMVTTGLRVSEVSGLQWKDLKLQNPAHLSCLGKGRRSRITPLNTETRQALGAWHEELKPELTDPVFPSNRDTSMSTDAVAQRITVNAQKAAVSYPAIARKHITPHTLRHTCAMRLLQSGVGIATIALWLGHQSIETTQIYLHEDLSMKERALAGLDPIGNKPTHFQPDDELLSFLEGL
jgi:integrase/recombinase XerD